jgi:hypothetical protein
MRVLVMGWGADILEWMTSTAWSASSAAAAWRVQRCRDSAEIHAVSFMYIARFPFSRYSRVRGQDSGSQSINLGIYGQSPIFR